MTLCLRPLCQKMPLDLLRYPASHELLGDLVAGELAGPVDFTAEGLEAEVESAGAGVQQNAGDLEPAGGLLLSELLHEAVRQPARTIRHEHHVRVFKALLFHKA